jgi:short-subunit dehydrogenase
MPDSCLVIGAGPGVSAAVARRFGREGFILGLIARREQNLAQVAGTLAEAGIKAKTFVGDEADNTGLDQTIRKAVVEIGAPRVLVYNAAAVTMKPPSQLSPDQLLRDFQIGVVAALTAVQAVLPGMRSRKAGTILLTGGGFAFEPMPNLSSLGIEKAGIRNLAFSLAKELAPEGIHVATVTIGGIVKAGTAFDPDRIAEEYWKLHVQTPDAFQREIVFRPES